LYDKNEKNERKIDEKYKRNIGDLTHTDSK